MELDLTGIVFRVSVMYLYALALLRISGKQSVSHLTTLDFIVTLIIGDLFDDAIGIVVDDNFHGFEDGHAARRVLIEVISQ